MIDVLYFLLVAVVSYFIGTINFSKIVAWNARRKDITKIGSHNPGTMNMLRSFGFGLALITFLAEIVKVGLTCLAFKLIFPNYGDVIYFFSGLFLMLGNDFPVWSKFKGGKGVACFAGIFLFSSLWYVALAFFVVCFILLVIIDIGSVISFTYTGFLSIGYTIYVWLLPVPYAWAITAMIWAMYIITLAKHHANLNRLFHGRENHVGFKGKIKTFFSHKKGEVIIDESCVDNQKPEQEIVVDVEKTTVEEDVKSENIVDAEEQVQGNESSEIDKNTETEENRNIDNITEEKISNNDESEEIIEENKEKTNNSTEDQE